nr:hypothetical protein BgiMline_011507 [Biomphalaria glabrata]
MSSLAQHATPSSVATVFPFPPDPPEKLIFPPSSLLMHAIGCGENEVVTVQLFGTWDREKPRQSDLLQERSLGNVTHYRESGQSNVTYYTEERLSKVVLLQETKA